MSLAQVGDWYERARQDSLRREGNVTELAMRDLHNEGSRVIFAIISNAEQRHRELLECLHNLRQQAGRDG